MRGDKMELDQMKDAIKKGIEEKLGDDIMDLDVAVSIHNYQSDENFTRISCLVWSTHIKIIKPASKWDMIKLAMPYFIRRIFPPKTVEVDHTVGLPGMRDIVKSKLASLVYGADELIEEDPEVYVDWCINSGSEGLKYTYNDKTFCGYQ